MNAVAAPRLLVCSPGSGGGKTTFACGLMQALARRGMRVQACKCGPDYIDPLFHSSVIGAPSRNLDLFFMGKGQVRRLVAEGARESDITVIEGAMGYYDGIAVSDKASAWDIARATETPAILVVDGRGRARSIAAEVRGYLGFRQPSLIAGVVLNRVSPALFPRLKEVVEAECGIPVMGCLPVLEDCGLESRHLGLVPAGEVEGLRDKLARLAAAVEEYVDVDALVALAESAPALAREPEALPEAVEGGPLIAVARDDAFCFYYDDTLRLLERLGARIVEFSPLHDAGLPAGTRGLYLGGGYPELHARELSDNAAMRAAIRRAIEAGVPTIAECGGFMYLHEWLEDDAGARWPMTGAIPGTSFKVGRLGRFGYIDIEARRDNLLAAAGEGMPAHEFHYWDSDDAGDAFRARKPQGTREWDCAHASATLYAGYPHLCLHARPEAAARFVRACAAFPENAASGAVLPGNCAPCGRSERETLPRCAVPGENRTVRKEPSEQEGSVPSCAFMGPFEHGGDAYGLGDVLDFSASLNPVGMPTAVRAALHAAADASEAYPDPACRELVAAMAAAEGIPASWVLPCAGATDAIARVCLALKPRRALVCEPCYSGYEQAMQAVGSQVVRFFLQEGDDFTLTDAVLDKLGECDAAFIANPNNPTGRTVDAGLLRRMLDEAHRRGTAVVLDESFIGFTGEPSAVRLLEEYPNLVVVRSFTKLYAMAGVRLGALMSADVRTMDACHAVGQPWAVSTAAQMAGVAALREEGFAERTRAYVAEQRDWLSAKLRALGLHVVPSEANYLLCAAGAPLHGTLLERGVLVRRCANFPGLDDTWMRVAVRTPGENRQLVAALKEVLA